MRVRLPEAVSVLAFVLFLVNSRHTPVMSLPWLEDITGIVCSALVSSIFLPLRLFRLELARLRAEE